MYIYKETALRYFGRALTVCLVLSNMTATSKSRGLGDTVEKITRSTGIKKLVEKYGPEDCGCDERRDKLNEMFPYKNENS